MWVQIAKTREAEIQMLCIQRKEVLEGGEPDILKVPYHQQVIFWLQQGGEILLFCNIKIPRVVAQFPKDSLSIFMRTDTVLLWYANHRIEGPRFSMRQGLGFVERTLFTFLWNSWHFCLFTKTVRFQLTCGKKSLQTESISSKKFQCRSNGNRF